MASINVKPTRSELLQLKKKIKLAKTGHNLLKKKRDGLILEFFSILKQARNIRKELVASYAAALQKINMARAIDGDLAIKSISLALKGLPVVEVATKNIMGVKVPKIGFSEFKKSIFERGYGITSASSKIDEAALCYELVVEKVVRAAEIELTLKKLLMEIERTKRKVNALELITIPKLEQTAKYIRLRLDELERENFSRLKRMKTVAA
ncbi:MAG TPA: V-type ATP synthase subunit D [Candidatus Nanoarchaeia archaeon]|nr:V-type ATP synthase subunit D [Candidatus Nanoarchaeia archaeon]